MNVRKALGLMICVLFVISGYAQMGKMPMGMGNPKGKAELKANSGSITINYGRPALKNRDLAKDMAQLSPGKPWRMGSEQATVLTTPVELVFGSTKIPKGAYSLWLKLAAPGKYEMIFNSQTGQWGTMYDATKDFATVPMNEAKSSSSVDLLSIELKEAPGGGIFSLSWGEFLITTPFKITQ
jgi:hypothetical protein